MKIQTKDGIIVEIPDGMDPQSEALKAFVANIRQTSGPGEYVFLGQQGAAGQPAQPGAPGIPTPGAATIPGQDPAMAGAETPQEGQGGGFLDRLGRFAGAVSRGAGPVAAGTALGGGLGSLAGGVGAIPGAIAGAGITGLVIPAVDTAINTINNLFGTKYNTATSAFNDLFTRIGVAEPETEAEKIVQAISQGAAAGGSGAGLGQTLARFGSTPYIRGIGETLAAGALQQVTGGAGAGAGQATGEALGAGPVGQTALAVGGNLLGSGLGNVRFQRPQQAPIDEAAEAGVRLMTSDVRPPRTFAGKWLQSTSEKIPFSTGGMRRTQQAQRVSAVRDLVRQYGADDVAGISDDIMDDLLRTRSGRVQALSQQKGQVIEKLADAGQMPVPNTLNAIDDQIARLESLRTAEVQPIIARLQDWKTAIQDQPITNVEALRKQIGESFKAPELASVRTTGERALSDIYGALKNDMADFIETAGSEADLNKWMVANRELSSMMDDLEIPAIRQALNRGEATPELVNNALFSRKRSDVEALYRNLSEEGRALTRQAVLARAAEKAKSIDEISPDRFAREVARLGDQIGVVFKPEEQKQIEGLMRVLNVTRRAGQAAVNPPTGVQAVLPAGAAALASFFGGGLEGFLGTMATGAGISGAARIYESTPVRNILAKLPEVARGSADEAALFKRLAEVVSAVRELQGPEE